MTAIWSNALNRLSDKIADQNFDMWLRPIECCSVDDATIVLRAPNQYVRFWFESNYLNIILDELRNETSIDYSVTFAPDAEPVDSQASPSGEDDGEAGGEGPGHVSDEETSHDGGREQAGTEAPSGDPGSDERQVRSEVRRDSTSRATRPGSKSRSPSGVAVLAAGTNERTAGPPRSLERPRRTDLDGSDPETHDRGTLNARYTFDTFVAGPSNQLAFAAAQAAASASPPKYNPIFICGGVGLGKTHLLHAIGHHFRNDRAESRVLYLSGERFMNEYVHAIRTGQMHVFRQRYREGCEVLLVDDVQFLAGKDGTQDEFFHTFNALHDAHRQIVLTADRKPFEISDIADRLRTRFAWGLMADIAPPELEVRVAILRKKAAAESIHLPGDVALYIASAIKSNVRELEGALIRLAAFASLSRCSIDLEFARQSLDGSITRPREHLTTESIIKSVANYYGLKITDIKSARRHKSVAGPRAVAMYLARTHTSDSYPDLGRAFGGKHHTTVISAVEKITKRLKDDPGLRGQIHAIEGSFLR